MADVSEWRSERITIRDQIERSSAPVVEHQKMRALLLIAGILVDILAELRAGRAALSPRTQGQEGERDA
jgi:hypothetical protein